METAFDLDTSDARILMELDQLYRITGKSFRERLDLLDQYPALVQERDDLYLEKITLHNNLGQFEEARQLLSVRKFHPWEGGEGKVVGQFLLCHIELAKLAILDQRYKEATGLLSALKQYPENLGEGKLYGAQENDIHYLLGCAYEGMKMQDRAKEEFEAATVGISEPVQAIYYNDPQPDKIVYQALAWIKLGKKEKADTIFKKFIAFGQQHLNDEIRIDYFAVSLPDMLVFDIDINQRNKQHCAYLVGLGYLGLGEEDKGSQYLQEVLREDINHQGAAVHLKMQPFFKAGKKYSAV
jgi:tetratricopeptide (TPR) repeat protein